jgi:hypothetical protein
MENYNFESRKIIFDNPIPIESRNVELRRQRYFSKESMNEIKQIIKILKNDTPFISILPFQTSTITKAHQLFEIKEYLWYLPQKELLYSVKSDMYVYINLSYIYEEDLYYKEDMETEGVRMYADKNLSSIIKYALSPVSYEKYIRSTEEYSKSHKPRMMKDFEVFYIEYDNMKLINENIFNFDKKSKNQEILWLNAPMNSSRKNYILFKNDDDILTLATFHYIPKTNFYNQTQLVFENINYFEFDNYSEFLDFLTENEYSEIYLKT